MAKSKKRKANRRPTGAGIPADARYVNVTTLDDDVLRRMCEATQGTVAPVANILYLVAGIAAIALAAVTYLLFHADLTTSLILAGFGILFLYQRSTLSKNAGKRIGKELDRGGEGARTRTTFFTATEVGALDEDGSVHTFPYAAVESVKEDDRIFTLVLRDSAGIIPISKAGFTRGDATEFGDSIRHHVSAAEARMNAEVRKRPKKGRR